MNTEAGFRNRWWTAPVSIGAVVLAVASVIGPGYLRPVALVLAVAGAITFVYVLHGYDPWRNR